MNSDAIISCAQSEAGIQLADASYARTAKTLVDGFAPVYIDGQKIQGADNIWRKVGSGTQLLLFAATLCPVFAPYMTLNCAWSLDAYADTR